MKKIFTKIVLLTFLAISIAACSSDSDSSSPSSSNTISLTLNGVDQVATVVSASLIKSEMSNEKLLQIYAENEDYKFEVNFFGEYSANNTLPTGDYVYNDTTVEGFFYVSYKVNGNSYGMHSPDSGNLTISSINASTLKVSGTFNQVLTGGGDLNGETLPTTLTVTNGTFNNIKYEVITY